MDISTVPAGIIDAAKISPSVRTGSIRMKTTMTSPTGIDLPTEQIADICRRYRVSELSIFGSVLRENFRPDSVVDLLVEFEPDARIGFIELGRLEQELEDLLGRKIDLRTKRSLRPELRDEILRSAPVLYEAA
jgi:predicted nucleotidyltransferase